MKDIITIKPEDLQRDIDAEDFQMSDAEQLLSHRCDEIDTKKKYNLMRECASNLKEVMRAKNLIALAAPQIGYNCRIFCIQFEKTIKTFINPIITSAKGLELSRESDVSLPGKEYIRIRHNDIIITYQNTFGKIESGRMVGASATLVQKEIDYLDGLLLCDVGLEVDEDFDNATEEERQEVIDAYLDSIDMMSKKLDDMIHEDTDTKDIAKAIDFITSVEKGETILSEDVVTGQRIDNQTDE